MNLSRSKKLIVFMVALYYVVFCVSNIVVFAAAEDFITRKEFLVMYFGHREDGHADDNRLNLLGSNDTDGVHSDGINGRGDLHDLDGLGGDFLNVNRFRNDGGTDSHRLRCGRNMVDVEDDLH